MDATRRTSLFRSFALPLFAILTLAGAAHAVTLGYREDWPVLDDAEGWGGGSNATNPGTGGYHGENDGFLKIAVGPAAGNFGAQSQTNANFDGNWTAAGVTQVRVWLNDIDTDDPLEIHFGIGIGQTNFWQYNIGFLPPSNAWGEYVIDLNQSDFTRTHGSGTYAAALQGVTRILLRHDEAPYLSNPDPIAADLGIDHLLLTDGSVAVSPLPAHVGRPVQLAPPLPNPSRGPVTFSWVSPSGGDVTLQIVDAQGRSVRKVELGASAPGARNWRWDGKDDRGATVAPGSYRVRAVGEYGGTSRPLVRVR